MRSGKTVQQKNTAALGDVNDGALLSSLVAQHIRDSVIVTDAQCRIVWVNAAFEKTTEYCADEVVGRSPGAILQGVDSDARVRARMREAIQKREPIEVEILNYAKSGRHFLVELSIAPVFSSNGTLTNYISVQRDIMERKQFRAVSRDLSAYQEALDRHAIVSVADPQGKITFVNENFCRISGYSREELLGSSHRIVNSGHHPPGFFVEMWRRIARGEVWQGEIQNRTKSGDVYWVDTTIVPVIGENGRVERYVSIRYDVTDRKTIEIELKRLAERDPLTGLHNRSVLLQQIDAALASRRRADQGIGGALLLIDMDHFKDINDTLGHDVGDRMLCEAAARLTRYTRAGDTVARLGGDEFAVLAIGIEAQEQCEQLVQRLHEQLSQPIEMPEKKVTPSFSIGVAMYPIDGGDPMSLLKSADIAMYDAKRNGRNQWSLFDRSVVDRISLSVNVADRIRGAIDADEFQVAFQPQMALASGLFRGAEALVRWRTTQGFVPPSDFVPLAEENGLILPIGVAVLRKSLDAFRRLSEDGHDPGVVSVNVSPSQLKSSDFIDVVQDALNEHGLAPEVLELELTETALMGRSSEKVLKNLDALEKLGVSIALDDFGTGFSSLTHLKEFHVDVLKIDRSFIADMCRDPEDANLVRAILNLAHNLKLTTIAEGVETEEQMGFLRSNGCNIGQGYFFSKPLLWPDYEILVRDLSGGRLPHAS